MKSLPDMEVREILNRVYDEESSALNEELAKMQWESLPKEDWRCVDGDNSEYTDVFRQSFETRLVTINQYEQEFHYGQVRNERN